MRKYILLFFSSLLLLSCGEYQKVLKSTDPELKYNKAVEYFDKGDYMRASTLFDEVALYYRGTSRSAELLFYIASSYAGQRDYYSANEYYGAYTRSYPKGLRAAEAKFMVGYCYYKLSSEARLSQEDTKIAIESFQEFVDLFPRDERVSEANLLIDELMDRLAYKEYLSARLYYNMGHYLGWNNYLSATIVAKNALKNYPASTYRESLSFLILEAKYHQVLQSLAEKMQERCIDAIDEYYSFVAEFPAGKHRKEADKIFKDLEKIKVDK